MIHNAICQKKLIDINKQLKKTNPLALTKSGIPVTIAISNVHSLTLTIGAL